MKNDGCPLCGIEIFSAIPADLTQNDSLLKSIILKHLHIKLIDDQLLDLCALCKKTVIDWDHFAHKCWQTQDIFNRELKIDVISEECSSVKIKTENESKYIPVKCDIKDEDLPNEKLNKLRKGKILKLKKKAVSKKITLRHRRSETIIEKQKAIDVKTEEDAPVDDDDDDYLDNSDSDEENDEIKKKKTKKSRKPPPVVSFKCYICSVETNGWLSLSKHFSDKHSTSQTKVLCICGQYLITRSSVYRHNDLHNVAKGFVCSECNKRFLHRNVYKEHMLLHFPDKDCRHSCPHCQKKFVQRCVFKNHLKTHLPPELKYLFTCGVCGDKFTTKFNLRTHKLAKHDKIKNHICDECGRSFTTKGNLDLHKNSVHNDVKLFQCDVCSKKFKTKDLLKRHMKIHTDIKSKCPLCPALLKNKATLRAHMDIHNDVYRYTCNMCGKKFRKSNHLKRHINSHEGVRPYVCEWCSQSYTCKTNLNLHISKNHMKIPMKPNQSGIDYTNGSFMNEPTD